MEPSQSGSFADNLMAKAKPTWMLQTKTLVSIIPIQHGIPSQILCLIGMVKPVSESDSI